MKTTTKLSRVTIAAFLLSGITATAGAGEARAEDPQTYYVVQTNFTSSSTCESYWRTFINKDGNRGRYDRHTCLKNSTGRWTLTAYYRVSGSGGGAAVWGVGVLLLCCLRHNLAP